MYVSVSSLPHDSDMQMVGRAQQIACESMANDMMATAWAGKDASVANLRVPACDTCPPASCIVAA